MAFTQGQIITASELNSINSGACLTTTCPSYGATQTKTWYSHRPSGALLCSLRIDCGWFGGVHLTVQKLDASGSVISTLYDAEHSWSSHLTVTVNSTGPGWYKMYTNAAWIDATTWYFYYGQTDCQKGNKLTLYQDPSQGGNRLAGTKLTVSNLNSGLAGTI